MTNGNKTAEEKEWEQRLIDEDLGMNRGSPPRFWKKQKGSTELVRVRRTITVGNLADLGDVSEAVFKKNSGKVSPSGHGPE